MNKKRFIVDGIMVIDLEDKIPSILTNNKKQQERFIKNLNELHEENRELKKEVMEYYRIVNCGNCRYHNYDWYDDGDEFEVCDKGNTERLMYNQFCDEWEQL